MRQGKELPQAAVGRLLGVQGDPGGPFNRGTLWAKSGDVFSGRFGGDRWAAPYC
ncbi:MAG: hypothetical protein HY900_04960 [Deltaproteobacteria bacterium]|nr:hypothetical protein [Deltaproteobacteria bacterium]